MNLLVPTLALDLSLLNSLADSIDFPLGQKVAVNNGRRGALTKWANDHRGWAFLENGTNNGVAGSWNFCPLLWPQDDAWLIVNDDVTFKPGALAEIVKADPGNAHMVYLGEDTPYTAFVWTRRGFEQMGSFDENFWPAYYEDSEMRYRMSVAGAVTKTLFKESPIKHWKPDTGIGYQNMIKECEVYLKEYYRLKWGREDHCGPGFKHPGNNPAVRHDLWTLNPGMRELLRSIFYAWFSQPDCSCYK